MPAKHAPHKFARVDKPLTPLWKGPQEDGITFSLLSRFLVCRERFRLQVVEGLREPEAFNHKIEYGSMWHELEEAHAKHNPSNNPDRKANCDLEGQRALARYRQKLINANPLQQADIDKWYTLCKMHFPLYQSYWAKHPDTLSRKPLLEEAAFRVPYTLPSGRTVLLRGKFDSVFTAELTVGEYQALHHTAVANKPTRAIFLQENKTKGEIDEDGILHTVAGNLQSMLYQIALRTLADWPADQHCFSEGADGIRQLLPGNLPIAGTLYNVIRRPLSDRFAPKPRKGREKKVPGTDRKRREGMESSAQFYKRVIDGIAEETKESLRTNRPSTNFMRWKVILTDEDVETFKREVFNPILEQLCDWWVWIKADPFDPWRPRSQRELHASYKEVELNNVKFDLDNRCVPNNYHYRTPWGIYNSMFGGFRGDYFEYLTQARKSSLTRITNLFPELT